MNIRCSTTDEVWQAVADAHDRQRREGGFVLDDSKPAAIITSECYEELWQAVLAKCKELQHQPGGRPGMRDTGRLGSDGRSMSCVCHVGHDDGTDSVYHVTAYQQGGHRADRIEVAVNGPWLDSQDQFWSEQASDRGNAVVIGHTHYRILPDVPARDRDLAGHGGALFRIRKLGGTEVIETRNLWYQGVIPPKWRGQMPDDAEFAKDAQTAGRLA